MTSIDATNDYLIGWAIALCLLPGVVVFTIFAVRSIFGAGTKEDSDT